MQIETPPTEKPYDKPDGERRGLVIVNTGDGKGKSTAAFGLALRAHGRGKAVKIYQFMKVPSARFGEHRMFEQIGIPIEGLGDGFSWKSQDLEHSAQLARDGWGRAAATILAGEHFLVVLDEITYPLIYGWLPLAGRAARLARSAEGRARGADRASRAAGADRGGRYGDRDADDQARLPGRHSRAAWHRRLRP